jgi:hypothetical protein
VRYDLKAALLPAAALLATPYAHPHDLAITAISLAFLAKDQMAFALMRAEQTTMLLLFVASLVIIITFGGTPLGSIVILAVLGIILRRAVYRAPRPRAFIPATS